MTRLAHRPRRLALLAALAIALASALAVLVLRPLAGDARTTSSCPAGGLTSTSAGLQQPEVRRSVGGVLSTTIRLKPATVELLGQQVTTDLYEGSLPGPTLVVCPGDTLRVRYVNEIGAMSNLHLHGMHVSPRGRGDNVLRHVMPGATAVYEYKIPKDQEPGTNWYHPHMHGLTEAQVSAGMAGALVVQGRGGRDQAGLTGVPERVMVLQRFSVANGKVVDDAAATAGDARFLLNGRLRPTIRIRPGELQRWRIVNASADAFARLRLTGATFRVIAQDGNAVRRPYEVSTMLLAAGERRDVLVRGGKAGTTRLETLAFTQPFVNTARQTIADVVSEGAPARRRVLPRGFAPAEDLRKARVARRREITFSSQFPRFLINGKTFNPRRIDQTMKLGTVEEWRIVNASNEWHSFHMHQNPYQVVAVDDTRLKAPYYADDAPIPPHGTITMRTRFKDFTGKFVFHCHLLSHEDGGMMSLVQVVR